MLKCSKNMKQRKLLEKLPQTSRERPIPIYTSIWLSRNEPVLEKEQMIESLVMACDWLISRSMCQIEKIPPEQNPHNYSYPDWIGAAREYNAREKCWTVFGPLWHTGQMIKAMVLANQVLRDDRLIQSAKTAADFILRARISNPDDSDFGAILAEENAQPGMSATSCMLESLDGLIYLSECTGNELYWQVVIDALDWAGRNLFLPDEGLFLDDFDFNKRKARSSPNTLLHNVPGRPLIEDGVFLKAYRKTGTPECNKIFFAVAERLLEEEYPQGNWIKFPPCDQIAGIMHPRQAFWWSRPMVMAWKESSEKKYLDCAIRSATWYKHAQRLDGGMFRTTNIDFKTESYGNATSGTLSACCLWRDLIVEGKGDDFINSFRLALKFAHSMQFKTVSDKNIQGAILEKVLPPDGSDSLPYYIRDLGTIFYVQALSQAIVDDLL